MCQVWWRILVVVAWSLISLLSLNFSSMLLVVAGISYIWYANYKSRFDNLQVHFSKAWVFIRWAIREANSLHGGSMRSVSDLQTLSRFEFLAFPAKAPRVIPVYWLGPFPQVGSSLIQTVLLHQIALVILVVEVFCVLLMGLWKVVSGLVFIMLIMLLRLRYGRLSKFFILLNVLVGIIYR